MSSSSPNLGVPFLSSAQAQKEVVVNAAITQLDSASNAVLGVAMGDADQTLTALQFTNSAVFECTGGLTADRHLTVPNTFRVFIVNNKTTGGHNIIVKSSGGITVTVLAGTPQLIYSDGNGSAVAINGTNPLNVVFDDGAWELPLLSPEEPVDAPEQWSFITSEPI